MNPSAEDQPELVLSDVHVGTCPPGQSVWSTRFVCLAGETAECVDAATSSFDRDNDLVLSRPARPRTALTIAHRLETPISTCGTQIWRGACLLADYLLNFPQVVRQQQVLELGAGTGLVSIVAAGAAGCSVVLTDVCEAALSLAHQNAAVNLPTWQRLPQPAGPHSSCQGSLTCRSLDWSSFLHTDGSSLSDTELLELLNSQLLVHAQGAQQDTEAAGTTPAAAAAAAADSTEQGLHHGGKAPPHAGAAHGEPGPGSNTWVWKEEDLQQLSRVGVLLAADVVYEPVLTEAFMHTAHTLMSWLRNKQPREQQQQQQQPPAGSTSATGRAAQDRHPAASPDSPTKHQGPVLYVAAEKRYNFTLRDMDAVATAWDHFLSFVTPAGSSSCQRGADIREHGHTSGDKMDGVPPLFMGEPVDWRAMPQLLTPYDRCPELELWRLWLPD